MLKDLLIQLLVLQNVHQKKIIYNGGKMGKKKKKNKKE